MNRQVVLKQRPDGMLTNDDVDIIETGVRPLEDLEVANSWP